MYAIRYTYDRPRFQVIVPNDDAVSRRLVTAEDVRIMIDSPVADDAKLNKLIDGVSAKCVVACRLARDGARAATFGLESVKSTWVPTQYSENRSSQLSLPWRVPINTADMEVTEEGVELEIDVDFRVLEGAILERLSEGTPSAWSYGTIIAEYTTGWLLGSDASNDLEGELPPENLVAAVIDQVKLEYERLDQERSLRSESVDGIWSGTYSVDGGDSIEKDGLLRVLHAALAPYKHMVIS